MQYGYPRRRTFRARIPYAILLVLALLASGQPRRAQVSTGVIRLEVGDPSGGGMESTCRLRNPSGGFDRQFSTDANGVFTLASLPTGRYRLEITRSGFGPQSLLIEV